MDLNKIIIALVIVLIVLVVAEFLMFNTNFAKEDSKVIVTSGSELNQGDIFSIRLTDLNGTPISNQNVNVTIVDANGGESHHSVVTDANGDGIFSLDVSIKGNCVITVTYGGNEHYDASNITQNIQINEKIVEEQSTSSKEYYSDSGYLIVFDSDNTLHLVDSQGKTIPGSGSNYYMDGDRVVMTGKG